MGWSNELTQSRDLLFARAISVIPANSRSLHSPLKRLGRDDKVEENMFCTPEDVLYPAQIGGFYGAALPAFTPCPTRSATNRAAFTALTTFPEKM